MIVINVDIGRRWNVRIEDISFYKEIFYYTYELRSVFLIYLFFLKIQLYIFNIYNCKKTYLYIERDICTFVKNWLYPSAARSYVNRLRFKFSFLTSSLGKSCPFSKTILARIDHLVFKYCRSL